MVNVFSIYGYYIVNTCSFYKDQPIVDPKTPAQIRLVHFVASLELKNI